MVSLIHVTLDLPLVVVAPLTTIPRFSQVTNILTLINHYTWPNHLNGLLILYSIGEIFNFRINPYILSILIYVHSPVRHVSYLPNILTHKACSIAEVITVL